MPKASERYNLGSTDMRLHSAFPRSCSVFTGRTAELQRALSLLPSTALLVVYGLAGIGKSEFVYRLVEQLPGTDAVSMMCPLRVCAKPDQTVREFMSQLVLRLHRAGSKSVGSTARRSTTDTDGEWDQVVVALEEAGEPRLLCLDDLHLLDAEARLQVAGLLGHLSRHLRRSKVVACARSELALPSSSAVPAVVRLGPLNAQESSQLVEKLCQRLSHPVPMGEQTPALRSGSPVLIRETLLPTVDGVVMSSTWGLDSLSSLTTQQRQILVLAHVHSGPRALSIQELSERFPSLTSPVDDVRVLANRFYLNLVYATTTSVTSDPQPRFERAKIVLPEPLWLVLQAQWNELDLQETRRGVASLLLDRWRGAPQRAAQEGIDAIHQLQLAECELQAVLVLPQIHRSIAAAWLDAELVRELMVLRQKLHRMEGEAALAASAEVALSMVRHLLNRSLVQNARSILSSLHSLPLIVRSARYLCLLGEVCLRSGQLDDARRHLEEALGKSNVPREQLRIRVQLTQTLALQGERALAQTLLAQTRDHQELSGETNLLRWKGTQTLNHLLEDRPEDAAQIGRQLHPLLKGGASGLEWALFAVCAQVEVDAIDEAQRVLDHILFQAASHGVSEAKLSTEMVPILSLIRGLIAGERGELAVARTLLSESLSRLESQGDGLAATVAAFYLSRVYFKLGDLLSARSTLCIAMQWARQAASPPIVHRIELLQVQVLLGLDSEHEASLALLRCFQSTSSLPAQGLFLEAKSLEGRLSAVRVAQSPQREDKLCQALQALTKTLELCLGIEPFVRHRIELEHIELSMLLGKRSEAELQALRQRIVQTKEYYAARHRPYEETRAALALCWLAILSGQPRDLAEADACLGRAQVCSTRHAFGGLFQRGLLLDAALQNRQGQTRRALELLRKGVAEVAGASETLEAQLLRAALQALDCPGKESAQPEFLAWILSSLGLRGVLPFELLSRTSQREASEFDRRQALLSYELVIEPDRGSITRGGSVDAVSHVVAINGRPLLAQLLCSLVFASKEGASAEHLFYEVWGGREYHPLQHRNTIYVAIGRLRQALRALLPSRELIETTACGWRLVDNIQICIIRPNRRELTATQRADRGVD